MLCTQMSKLVPRFTRNLGSIWQAALWSRMVSECASERRNIIRMWRRRVARRGLKSHRNLLLATTTANTANFPASRSQRKNRSAEKFHAQNTKYAFWRWYSTARQSWLKSASGLGFLLNEIIQNAGCWRKCQIKHSI